MEINQTQLTPKSEALPILQKDTLIPQNAENRNILSSLEKSRIAGDYYVDLIHRSIGRSEGNKPNISSLDQDDQNLLLNIEKSASVHQTEQKVMKELRGWGAKDILMQAYSGTAREQLIQDGSQYTLIETSNGMYQLLVDSHLFEKLRPGVQGLAVKVPNGISYIMIRDYKNKSNEFIRREQEENIPHETHHVIWGFARQDKLVETQESHPEMSKAYSRFQDELLAKACSGGSLVGYSHLSMMDAKALAEFTQKNPELCQEIYSQTNAMNTYLVDVSRTIQNCENVVDSDIILATMKSRSFDELRNNLQELMVEINQQPKKPAATPLPSSWNVV
ncbi:hypothetical protein HGB07_08055 [Candidatus Roizmanbacteria bacterium]|nr:hypothetical protein [Candidatus Roizmanbacteria bacterium]